MPCNAAPPPVVGGYSVIPPFTTNTAHGIRVVYPIYARALPFYFPNYISFSQNHNKEGRKRERKKGHLSIKCTN